MSVQTIISELLDEMARPDLDTLCKNKVPEAIRAAHSARKFTKDIREVILTDPEIMENGRVRIITSMDVPRLRDVVGVRLFSGYTEVPGSDPFLFNEISMLPGQQFLNRNEVGVKDYYGIHYPHLYSKIGGELLLQGVDKQTKAIKLTILAWPNVELNTLTQELDTDSFIVEQYPEVIKGYLRRDLAVIVQKNSFTQIASGLLKSARDDMLNAEASEYL